MEHPIEEINRLLEPGAVTDYARRRFSMADATQLSCAISLKRIADAIINPSNKYGESIFEAVATAMREER